MRGSRVGVVRDDRFFKGEIKSYFSERAAGAQRRSARAPIPVFDAPPCKSSPVLTTHMDLFCDMRDTGNQQD